MTAKEGGESQHQKCTPQARRHTNSRCSEDLQAASLSTEEEKCHFSRLMMNIKIFRLPKPNKNLDSEQHLIHTVMGEEKDEWKENEKGLVLNAILKILLPLSSPLLTQGRKSK